MPKQQSINRTISKKWKQLDKMVCDWVIYCDRNGLQAPNIAVMFMDDNDNIKLSGPQHMESFTELPLVQQLFRKRCQKDLVVNNEASIRLRSGKAEDYSLSELQALVPKIVQVVKNPEGFLQEKKPRYIWREPAPAFWPSVLPFKSPTSGLPRPSRSQLEWVMQRFYCIAKIITLCMYMPVLSIIPVFFFGETEMMPTAEPYAVDHVAERTMEEQNVADQLEEDGAVEECEMCNDEREEEVEGVLSEEGKDEDMVGINTQEDEVVHFNNNQEKGNHHRSCLLNGLAALQEHVPSDMIGEYFTNQPTLKTRAMAALTQRESTKFNRRRNLQEGLRSPFVGRVTRSRNDFQ